MNVSRLVLCRASELPSLVEVERGENESTHGFSRALSAREGELVRAETGKSSLDHVVHYHIMQEWSLGQIS